VDKALAAYFPYRQGPLPLHDFLSKTCVQPSCLLDRLLSRHT
jgi:hypothetical protein